MNYIKKITPLILAFGFVGFWIVRNEYKAYMLDHRHELSVGLVTELNQGGRYNAGGFYIEGFFTIDRKNYKVTGIELYSKVSISACSKYLVGRQMPVVYSKDDPSNATWLITPREFKMYGYEFPDSLKILFSEIGK